VRSFNKKVSVEPRYFERVLIDMDFWREFALDMSFSSTPGTADPTLWVFHGHPGHSTKPLHVATARLLGYRWPTEFDPDIELPDEARASVAKAAELLPIADSDGIVCIPSVREGGAWRRAPQGPACHRHRRPMVFVQARPTPRPGRLPRKGPRALAPGRLLRAALQALPSSPFHLANLGWAQRRLQRPGQLPQARPRPAGDPHLQLSRRLDPTSGGRGAPGSFRRRGTAGRGPGAAGTPRLDPQRRGALRHLCSVEAHRGAAHRLESRPRRRRAAQHPPVHECAGCRPKRRWCASLEAQHSLEEGPRFGPRRNALVPPRP
jgi:hypothetical protein